MDLNLFRGAQGVFAALASTRPATADELAAERTPLGSRWQAGYMGRLYEARDTGVSFTVTRPVVEQLAADNAARLQAEYLRLTVVQGLPDADALAFIAENHGEYRFDDETGELVVRHPNCCGGGTERIGAGPDGRWRVGHGVSCGMAWDVVVADWCDQVHDDLGAHARTALSA